jgi:B12 binding domain
MASTYRTFEATRMSVGRVTTASGLPVGPYAQELASALIGRNKDRALSVLERAGDDGWELRDVEEMIIVPAVTKVGQLWIRGRLDDGTFSQAGAIAECVERSYRNLRFQCHPVSRTRLAIRQGAG